MKVIFDAGATSKVMRFLFFWLSSAELSEIDQRNRSAKSKSISEIDQRNSAKPMLCDLWSVRKDI